MKLLAAVLRRGALALAALMLVACDTRWVTVSSGGGDESARRVDHDGTGAAIVAGGYGWEANLGGDTFPGAPSNVLRSPFLAKYDAAGRHVWSRAFASGPHDPFGLSALGGPELAVMRSGAITLFMYLPGEVEMDGLRARGQVLARFGPDGRALWTRTPPADVFDSWGAALASDSQGQTLVAAAGGEPTTSIPAARGWVALYSVGGTLQWERSLPGNFQLDGAAFDSQDRPHVAGVLRADEGDALVVMQLDRGTGATVWEQQLPLGPLGVSGVELTATGDRVLVGTTMSSGPSAASFTFAGQTFAFEDRDVRSDARGLLLALDVSGTPRWAREAGRAVNSVSAAGAVLVVLGEYLAGQDLGTGPLPAEGSLGPYLARYAAADGSVVWVEPVLGGLVLGNAVDLAPDGTVTAVGQIRRGPARFGGTVVYPSTPASADSDAWTWRRGP